MESELKRLQWTNKAQEKLNEDFARIIEKIIVVQKRVFRIMLWQCVALSATILAVTALWGWVLSRVK